jgi:hypothetical protein
MTTKTAQQNEMIELKFLLVLAYKGRWPYGTIVCAHARACVYMCMRLTQYHLNQWTDFHGAWKQENFIECALNADTVYQEVNNIILMWLLGK